MAEVNAEKFYSDHKKKWTHLIVVVGFDETNFYVHDPARKLGGKIKKVPIKKFRGSWEKLSPRCGRSMFVVFPE